jgi:Predicted integral membrane protein
MAAFHVWAGADSIHHRAAIREIDANDVFAALREGVEDFLASPSHYIFMGLIYPIIGVVLMVWASGANMLPLLFPLLSGFALVGPFAALGLYEISRRRESGLSWTFRDIVAVRHSPALPSILALGVLLSMVFVFWLVAAQQIYVAHFGEEAPSSLVAFFGNVLQTGVGRSMMFWGIAIGFGFALVVLASTVVAFPMLLDRDCGAATAIETSIRATFANPFPVALWGMIVVAMLAIGAIPLLVGLAVTMPILGHATWHLYRKMVVAEPVLTPRR